MRAGLLAILGGLCASALVVAWLASRPGEEEPTPWDAEPPPPAREAVSDEPPGPPILLGRPLPPRPDEPTPEARAHLEAASKAFEDSARLHEQGVLSSQDLRRARLDLEDARYAAGEIDERALHAVRAELFAEELVRLEGLHDAGAVPQTDVDRARVHVAFERYLSGEPRQVYADAWNLHRDRLQERDRALIEAGVLPREQAEKDLEAFQSTFPDPAGLEDR